MPFELLNPKGPERTGGYAHVAKITGGNIVYVAGQAPFDENGQVVGKGNFVVQFAQVIRNLKTAVEAAGGILTNMRYWRSTSPTCKPILMIKTRWVGVYREVFGKYFPAITLVQVGS